MYFPQELRFIIWLAFLQNPIATFGGIFPILVDSRIKLPIMWWATLSYFQIEVSLNDLLDIIVWRGSPLLNHTRGQLR
jgi:hypothetical protein